MNRSGDENRSVRNTKRRLRDALLRLMAEKPINEISVKELTEAVDVNRGTFYFHYSDVYGMLRSLEDDFFTQFDRILEQTPPPTGGPDAAYHYLTAIFAFLGENHDFCRVLLGENGDMKFVERVKERVGEKCSYFWQRSAQRTGPEGFALYNAFIIDGCVGVIRAWLNDGLRETPEEISRLAGTIILASVRSCIA